MHSTSLLLRSDAVIDAAMGAGVAEARRPRITVFDSGLGGLTVLSEVIKAAPGAEVIFAADDAVFPYGRLSEAALIARVVSVTAELIAMHRPDIVVIACNTASTVVLPPLRARWPGIGFIGTVPAIKPAAALSRSKRISVLATPGTVAREYTRELVRSFAGDCAVTLVGSPQLAGFVEAAMRGEPVEDAAVWAEIAPVFVETEGTRTDIVVLACTHYPLLLQTMERLAPWPVNWIDPAPAIARRVCQLLRERGEASAGLPHSREAGMVPALFTSGKPPNAALLAFLQGRGLVWRSNDGALSGA
jgi:glutamate racemase